MKLFSALVLLALFSSSLFAKQDELTSAQKHFQNFKLNKVLFNSNKNSVKNTNQDVAEYYFLDSTKMNFQMLFGFNSTTVYQYDDKGNVVSKIDYKDGVGTRTESIKNTYQYNSSNQVIEHINSTFSEETDSWTNNKTTYTYENGKLKEEVEATDASSVYVDYQKTEYIYNENGEVSEEIISSFYDVWNVISKRIHTYNEQGKLAETSEMSFDGTNYNLMAKDTYKYNSNGDLTEKTTESMYNGNDITTTAKEVYNYDESNRVVFHQSYSMYNDELTLSEEITYVYDENGNLESQSAKEYNEDLGELVNSVFLTFTYDMNLTKDMFFAPNDEEGDPLDGSFVNIPISFVMQYWGGDNWIDLGLKGDFFYSQKTINLSVKNIENANISIYPNPTTEFINVDLSNKAQSANFKLFSLTGEEMLSQDLMISNRVNIQSLQRGVYIYLLNENGVSYSGKIIKN